MKKALSTTQQTQLWEAIKAVEQHSQVELVVVLRARSADYPDVAWLWGVLLAWLVFTYMLFAPPLFTDEWLYAAPLLAFAIGYGLGRIPVLTRLGVNKARLQKHVEIMARAVFQKAGIHHTQAQIGVLVYVSCLEKIVYVLPDRGADLALPAAEWQALRAAMQSIFSTRQPLAALITEVTHSQAIFSRYLPPIAGDINELPDNLDVDL